MKSFFESIKNLETVFKFEGTIIEVFENNFYKIKINDHQFKCYFKENLENIFTNANINGIGIFKITDNEILIEIININNDIQKQIEEYVSMNEKILTLLSDKKCKEKINNIKNKKIPKYIKNIGFILIKKYKTDFSLDILKKLNCNLFFYYIDIKPEKNIILSNIIDKINLNKKNSILSILTNKDIFLSKLSNKENIKYLLNEKNNIYITTILEEDKNNNIISNTEDEISLFKISNKHFSNIDNFINFIEENQKTNFKKLNDILKNIYQNLNQKLNKYEIDIKRLYIYFENYFKNNKILKNDRMNKLKNIILLNIEFKRNEIYKIYCGIFNNLVKDNRINKICKDIIDYEKIYGKEIKFLSIYNTDN